MDAYTSNRSAVNAVTLEASSIASPVVAFAANRLQPTPKQRGYLRNRGAWREDMSFGEARRVIGDLKRDAG